MTTAASGNKFPKEIIFDEGVHRTVVPEWNQFWFEFEDNGGNIEEEIERIKTAFGIQTEIALFMKNAYLLPQLGKKILKEIDHAIVIYPVTDLMGRPPGERAVALAGGNEVLIETLPTDESGCNSSDQIAPAGTPDSMELENSVVNDAEPNVETMNEEKSGIDGSPGQPLNISESGSSHCETMETVALGDSVDTSKVTTFSADETASEASASETTAIAPSDISSVIDSILVQAENTVGDLTHEGNKNEKSSGFLTSTPGKDLHTSDSMNIPADPKIGTVTTETMETVASDGSFDTSEVTQTYSANETATEAFASQATAIAPSDISSVIDSILVQAENTIIGDLTHEGNENEKSSGFLTSTPKKVLLTSDSLNIPADPDVNTVDKAQGEADEEDKMIQVDLRKAKSLPLPTSPSKPNVMTRRMSLRRTSSTSLDENLESPKRRRAMNPEVSKQQQVDPTQGTTENSGESKKMMDPPRTPLLRRRSHRISSRQLSGITLETTTPLSTIADDPSTQPSAMMETVDHNDSVTITTDEVTASGVPVQK